MNWEAIGASSELAGAIGVIVTLVYLAGQLRQNTEALRRATASERLQRDYEIVLPIVESREFASLWLQGGERPSDLAEVDRQRLMFFERRAIGLWHHVYQLNALGLLPDENWREQTWMMQRIGQRDAMRATWEFYKGSYDEPFRRFLEQQFEIGRSAAREAASRGSRSADGA